MLESFLYLIFFLNVCTFITQYFVLYHLFIKLQKLVNANVRVGEKTPFHSTSQSSYIAVLPFFVKGVTFFAHSLCKHWVGTSAAM